jgi:hypothetical protein
VSEHALENQSLSVVCSHVAVRSLLQVVAACLNRRPEYRALSKKVFNEPLTEDNTSKAMAAFMQTLIASDYSLARWLKGDQNAMTVHHACHSPGTHSCPEPRKHLARH